MGSQAPCISLYARLLPGITNVTDRARYYSMYPWFAWSFAKRNSSRDPNGFIELFRRADCLFTLITERYARRGRDAPNHDGAAMIGRDTLLPALDRLEAGKTLRLSDYATTEEVGSRYFKNRLGGLGQYYLGTLQDLGLVRGEHRPWIQFTQERGEVLAKAVDEFVPADLFFRTLNEDAVTLARLDKLSNFAFSCIEESTREHEFLLNLFFNRDGKYELDGQQRKRSLGLLLSLILANAKAESGMVSANFAKNALYGQSLGDAGTWVVPESMTQTARFWQIYARNDLLSVAAQTIFFVALGVLRDADAVSNSQDGLSAIGVSALTCESPCVNFVTTPAPRSVYVQLNEVWSSNRIFHPPAPTNPRLKQAVKVLHDLGLVRNDRDSVATALTNLGHAILGECNGA